jgi:NADH-quinone oxidoreductase subunit G
VGSLLDKDFLFAQRVWSLKRTAGIDPFTSSGDNIWVEHNQGRVYRIKPRTNMDINTWWITDEVRYGWKFVHSDNRLVAPTRKQHGVQVDATWTRAYKQVIDTIRGASKAALVISPTLTTEEAYLLVRAVRSMNEHVSLFLGPVPIDGNDIEYPNPQAGKPFVQRAEKVPNKNGVKRVLDAVGGGYKEFDTFVRNAKDFDAVVLTANFPSAWVTDDLVDALNGRKTILIDTTHSVLCDKADVVLPSATFAEKSGSFENCNSMMQHFDQAIPTQHDSKSEGQIALDLIELANGGTLREHVPGFGAQIVDEQPGQVPGASDSILLPRAELYDAKTIRARMGKDFDGLRLVAESVADAAPEELIESDMELIEL